MLTNQHLNEISVFWKTIRQDLAKHLGITTKNFRKKVARKQISVDLFYELINKRAPEYPGFKKQCNGCGQCCLITQCQLSYELFGEEELCSALRFDGEKYRCGLAVDPLTFMADAANFEDKQVRRLINKYLSDTYAAMLGIGVCCDAEIEPNEIVQNISPKTVQELPVEG